MRRKGFTLVEIMIVVGILAILASVVVPSVLQSRITANEAIAQANLRTIFSACSMYSYAHNGEYPENEEELKKAVPPYQRQSFCELTINGYYYECNFAKNSYLITASPAICGTTGRKVFTITESGTITTSVCE